MKYTYGDLVKLAKEGYFDVIVHGCNCFCRMGSGIAKQIKEEFPYAYHVDQMTIKGDKHKLGTILLAENLNVSGHGVIVCNAYTQYNYGYDGKQYVDYEAVRSCIRELYTLYAGRGMSFGFPQIGCGLAGGEWSIVEKIIEEEMHNEDYTIVVYDKE